MDHPIFSILDNYRLEIEQLKEQIKGIMEEISQVKQNARHEALESMTEAENNDEAMLLAAHFYWLHDDLIDAQTVGVFLGTAAQGVAMKVKSLALTLKCYDCGEMTEYYPTSRTNAKYHIRSGTCVCSACQLERDNGHTRRAKEYADRIATLKQMPYQQYLQTEHWQSTRKQMLKRARFSCQLCSAKGELHVHHRTYANRGNEQYGDLIVLCANCHAKFHDKLENS